jgi:hypothetical protein
MLVVVRTRRKLEVGAAKSRRGGGVPGVQFAEYSYTVHVHTRQGHTASHIAGPPGRPLGLSLDKGRREQHAARRAVANRLRGAGVMKGVLGLVWYRG